MGLGLAVIDVSTGKTFTYETHSSHDDYTYSLDEIFRFIQSYSPKEIVLHCVNVKLSTDEIINYLEISSTPVHVNFYDDKTELLKPEFENKLLTKIFNIKSSLSPVEYIGLERSHASLISYIYLSNLHMSTMKILLQKFLNPNFGNPKNFLCCLTILLIN